MKKIILLAIALVTMLVSLNGCFWGYPEDGRGGGHHDRDRGERHDHDRDGGSYERR